MVIVTWRFTTTPGQISKGLEWASGNTEIQEKEGFLPQKKWLLRPRTGDVNRFSAAAQFASIKEYGEWMAKAGANSAWQDRVRGLAEADWYAGTEVTISEVVEET